MHVNATSPNGEGPFHTAIVRKKCTYAGAASADPQTRAAANTRFSIMM